MKTLFFDIDDTIYDRSLPFTAACDAFFTEKLPDPYAAYLSCNRRGNEVFHASQRGEITMDEMYIYRYCRGFADVGITLSPKEALVFQGHYRSMQQKITCTETMHEILRLCSGSGARMGLLTNGPSEKQRGKISALGIGRYFLPGLTVVSGEDGADKPDQEIFRLAQRLAGVPPEEIILVGDSFSQDILPSAAAGWSSVWYNRRKAVPAMSVPQNCTEVGSEEELLLLMRKICSWLASAGKTDS